MLTERQQFLSDQTQWRKNLLRLKYGYKNILGDKQKQMGLVVICAILVAAIIGCRIYGKAGGFASVVAGLWSCAIHVCGFFLIFGYFIINGIPRGAEAISDNLQRAEIVNEVEEPPILLERKCSPENDRIHIMEFQTIGISLSLWTNNQIAAESALNAYIVKVQEAAKRNRVLIHTVESEGAFPDIMRWEESYLPVGEGVLALGVTVAGTAVTVNLNRTPHVLIGGSTGSGKSVLMGLIFMQILEKNMILYVADFKGGLDYNGDIWNDKCSVITSVDEVTNTLDEVVAELERRKHLFYTAGCKNITMYNNHTGLDLPRIVFGCDEIAELTDKSGISDKELKSKIDHVVSRLATIARQGRALGIHLVLATQRPDAAVLPGQIKNNIDFRACGRADNTLALIILDNADAADMLPKDGHRFMLSDGTIFLPYYWGEE